LNAKHQRTLDKGLCKSKFTQLMQDYDLYKYLTGLSGVGTCPDAGKPTFVDDVWEYLLPSKLKQRAKIVAMREHEFSHATIFCFIAATWTTTTPATPAMEALPCPRRTRPRRLRQASRKPLKSPQADAKSPAAIRSTSYGSRSAGPHP
ncbi:hypothetical protein PR002_g31976, partial [Phytophthora rubi]